MLDLLADFTLFEHAGDNAGGGLRKLLARYTQYEAVQLIVARAKDPARRRGLIHHTQGSGKTLAMVFAAAKLLREPAMRNPTVLLVADRVQLVRQMWDQFRTAGMPRLDVPETAGELRDALGPRDQRGLIFTTVHKFRDAPLLNERDNIVVMVDEAHRTQEGNLGLTMRAALPNATLIAFTGTPIAELGRNTFATFGDEGDPGRTLHAYGTDQSIADGTTVPIHVSPRKVEFALDKDALDEAFAQMTADEGLDDDEAETLARRASRVSTFFANPERIRRVCADIVEHFYATVDPLGMKAQVVVYDRAACVAYHHEISRLLAQRHAAEGHEPGDGPDECAVVMTVSTAKGEDSEWEAHALTDQQEQALLARFRTFGDELKFLVCTSKLGTGFDAPIEGVLYLDKPLKNHTLFQTITRTNRVWRNPDTGKDKRYGTVVDYVGLGNGFARAMVPADPDANRRSIDVDGLIDTFEAQLAHTMVRFAGIDVDDVTAQTLIEAQKRLPTRADEDDFAADYLMLEGIWEAAYPHTRLLPLRARYGFLAKIYWSIQPSDGADALLWQRLGAKTLGLVHSHMDDIHIRRGSDVVVADTETIRILIEEGSVASEADVAGKTAVDIVDSIAARLKALMDGESGDHPVVASLAERLDRLRQRTLAAAQQSIDWLREAFALARDLTEAERADETGTLDVLPDPRVGALTQIFRECAPDDAPAVIERVVRDVDAIVKQVRYDGWASTQKGDRVVRREVRGVLRKHQMHDVPGLFERAYEYIAAHY